MPFKEIHPGGTWSEGRDETGLLSRRQGRRTGISWASQDCTGLLSTHCRREKGLALGCGDHDNTLPLIPCLPHRGHVPPSSDPCHHPSTLSSLANSSAPSSFVINTTAALFSPDSVNKTLFGTESAQFWISRYVHLVFFYLLSVFTFN